MIIGLDASRANVANRTGTEKYSWQMVKLLPTLLPDHKFRLYVRESWRSDMPPVGPNVEIRVLRWPPAIFWSHLRLSWEMLWQAPDLLFVPSDTVPLIHPAKTITTIHDIAFERFPELYLKHSIQRDIGWKKPLINILIKILTLGKYSASELDYHRWSVRQAIRTCPNILTVSNFTKREIIDIFKVDDQRITVTLLGIDDLTAADTSSSPNLNALGIKRPYFLYVGRLETKKNIDHLVSAYLKYCTQEPHPCDLVLAGNPGQGWAEQLKIIQSSGLADRIHLLGWQTDAQVQLLQQQAVAFIFISRYEGFGIPPIHSLKYGVPVLASRAGSLPEILDQAAYYVDHENDEAIVAGLRAIQNDQALRQRLIAIGLRRSQIFSWTATGQSTADLIQRLFAKS